MTTAAAAAADFLRGLGAETARAAGDVTEATAAREATGRAAEVGVAEGDGGAPSGGRTGGRDARGAPKQKKKGRRKAGHRAGRGYDERRAGRGDGAG